MKGRKDVQQDHESKKLFQGILILTLSSVITKILSAVYRVPFQNIVGDVGFYIYQQVYPIYGIVIALSSSGFPVAVSKMVAEREAAGENSYRAFLNAVFLTLGLFSSGLFLAVFFTAGKLAAWMGDPRLSPLIRTVSCSFLLMPVISAIRGVYQGQGKMVPTALSQVLEQAVRVAAILLLSFWLVHGGFSLYAAGQGAMAGSVLGGAVSAAVLVFYLVKGGRQEKAARLLEWKDVKQAARSLFCGGIAVCISGLVLVLFQFVDSLHLYALLTDAGWGAEAAKKLKGIYDRGQPFLQLGTVAASSFALNLVPVIALEYKKGRRKSLEKQVQAALKISTAVGAGAAAGLIGIMPFANTMLFENSAGTAVLSVFSVSILFSTWILTLSGILQGMGKVYTPAVAIAAGVLLKYGLNEIWVPRFGTMGASAATVAALGFISLILMIKLGKAYFQMLPALFFGKLALSLFAMSACLQLWLRLFARGLPGRAASVLAALGGTAIGAAVFLFCAARLRLLTDEEWGLVPFGTKLAGLKGKNRIGKQKP
ncbi:putative polysaccharide biosynthesis protein [Heyndrickxia coagulans]|uniref:putative polysaccharide biosynthesis protein n=1 Tax=Heyndrickxia coagulans TaxID=1398 RepID=UPI002164D143|nr:polysaccharide biosynthesis protein [Heyndrickxia coagulans]